MPPGSAPQSINQMTANITSPEATNMTSPEAANMTSPEAALDHPPVLSPIALKTIMSTMDNIQKNTKVEDLQLNKTNDRLKTAAVSISRKLIVVKQTDSNLEDFIVQDSVGKHNLHHFSMFSCICCCILLVFQCLYL